LYKALHFCFFFDVLNVVLFEMNKSTTTALETAFCYFRIHKLEKPRILKGGKNPVTLADLQLGYAFEWAKSHLPVLQRLPF